MKDTNDLHLNADKELFWGFMWHETDTSWMIVFLNHGTKTIVFFKSTAAYYCDII